MSASLLGSFYNNHEPYLTYFNFKLCSRERASASGSGPKPLLLPLEVGQKVLGSWDLRQVPCPNLLFPLNRDKDTVLCNVLHPMCS